jgi:hypothetical protein
MNRSSRRESAPFILMNRADSRPLGTFIEKLSEDSYWRFTHWPVNRFGRRESAWALR